jgi:hypothetical protein
MDTVEVEVPRIPDREELLALLRERGLDAQPHDAEDWVGIEVPCADDDENACADVLHRLELWLGETELPLIPVLGDGRVFLRPPGN